MSRYKKNQRETTAKLNSLFDDMFSGQAQADNLKKHGAGKSRKAFTDYFNAGGSPAVEEKKELSPIDRKIQGLKNMLADPGASEGEKETAKKILKRLEAKKAKEAETC